MNSSNLSTTDNTRPTAAFMRPGDRAKARVTGGVEFRAGDGPMIRIEPDYALELERAEMSMVVSWQEEGHPMNAAVPLVQFEEFVADGRIVIDA
ncbi:hypothetical protein [Ottowia sp.]|uniref:hypothetical protein n=1 Tax=Ottowia sp. TaxID=1898956 RepID=UPI001D51A411|nr:hypothetical protein [Ottowia sp.]MCP5258522.1 hypothetical protein [Burkholderiaceae bacterium]MCB2025686.1 hypothetical protein [Ottowia sp.]MCB2038709.1 hypothetical protein [Ottowia sp.]HPK32982.1 hypothetical protein [Ottowia sp.]HPR45834.1 hypothetical protein [Ottowia sp.]